LLPNDAGVLGHLRLAVIDPVGGVQPLWSADGRSVLVFNGEIYNYRQLRERLANAGVTWRTQSDSEVLLELLCREGPRALAQLRGMYAFAFWDGHRERAVLARDPNGIKPLFLRQSRDTLWFASEAKAFPPTANWRPQLAPDQLHLLLNLRYPAGGSGLMHGVTQLAPGHCLEWSLHGARTTRIDEPQVAGLGVPDVRDAIVESVNAHLVADVPVATYLSGGIDSGIVSYVATRVAAATMQSFTIDAGDDPREAINAAESARWLGIPNRVASLAEAGTDSLTWLLWHLEVPKVNALQSAAVAQLASGDVKVCLSGLGGDELFLGYRAHRHLSLAARVGKSLGGLAAPLGRVAARRFFDTQVFAEPWRVAKMVEAGRDIPAMYALLRNVWDGSLQRERIYGERMLDQELPDVQDWVRARWPPASSAVGAMAEFEWDNKMVDDLLWQEDRTSMACGVEVRVPFVDQRLRLGLSPLLELMSEHPGTKHILKRSFADELPREITRRPKSGFQLDIAREFDPLFGAVLGDWLSPNRVRRHRLFQPTFVAHLLRLERTKAHRWHFFLLLLMAQAHRWIELFETGEVACPAQPTLIRLRS
jgi:asparagine synthase (glutamine-hydrolysing)